VKEAADRLGLAFFAYLPRSVRKDPIGNVVTETGMKPFSDRVLFALMFALASLGLAAATGNPLAGTWKLNPAKSRFTGDTFTYTATASGFHYTNDSTVSYDFATDGKDYPTITDRTIAWTKAGDNAWDGVVKDGKGTVLTKAHRVLSADGKKLTGNYTAYHPDGTTAESSDEYERVSGGPGLAGKWKNVKDTPAASTFTVTFSGPGQVTIEFPAFQQTISGALDGSAMAVKGPTIPDGLTASYKPAGKDKWDYTQVLGGKVFTKGTMTVSADGKLLTRTTWVPGKESEKSVAVYDKQ